MTAEDKAKLNKLFEGIELGIRARQTQIDLLWLRLDFLESLHKRDVKRHHKDLMKACTSDKVKVLFENENEL